MSADMHVESRRIGAQQVVMDSRDLDPAFDQFGHHGIDFGFKENEIAHHHGAAMRRLEGDPTAKRQAPA